MCPMWRFRTCSLRPGADKKWYILGVFSIGTSVFCDGVIETLIKEYFKTETIECPTFCDKNIDITLKITFDQNVNVPPVPDASRKEIHPGLITSIYDRFGFDRFWKKTCGTQTFCLIIWTISLFFMLSHKIHTYSFRPGADRMWCILSMFSIGMCILCDRVAKISEMYDFHQEKQ